MSELVQRLEKLIAERSLFRPGEAILVGVSGGLDSMVLLHVLHQLASGQEWKLTVAHLNHQLRGRSSDADERFVRKAAEKLELPFFAERANVKELAGEKKLSIEMAARQLRHEFFARVAHERSIQKIALAHHADDQVELFFLRLLRGAGVDGLAGMRWRSPSPVAADIQLVRPLLGVQKRELQAFAQEARIRSREDATNASIDFLRNRVRHELLPLLQKQYQPAVCSIVLRLQEILAAEKEFVAGAAEEWLRTSLPDPPGPKKIAQRGRSVDFASLTLALQRRTLQLQLRRLGLPVDFELIEQLRLIPDKSVTITPGLAVWRNKTGQIEAQKIAETVFNFQQKNVDLFGRRGIVLFNGLRIDWERQVAKSDSEPAHKAGEEMEVFDAEKVGRKVVLRHWNPGDRFQPIGMPCSVKLQDLFVNRKIPRNKRHGLVLAATAYGEVFWVEGLRIGERFKVLKDSTMLLQWRWQRNLT